MSVPQHQGVAVIGSISADLTTFSQRLPQPGETLIGDSFTLVLGGKGANQSIAAARAGAPTWMIGCVGDDVFQSLTLDSLQDHGVNIDAVKTVPGPTGIAHIRVNSSTAQNDIVVVPQANSQLSADYAKAALTQLQGKIAIVMLQLETPVETTIGSVQAAHELGMLVLLDPAPATALPPELWQYVDYITPNETEATILTGIEVSDIPSAKEAATRMLTWGVGTVIITLAERGSVIATTDRIWHIGAYEATPIDTTAAGDAYAGVLAQSLAAGKPIEEAVRRAAAAGAWAVTIAGASPCLPTSANLDTVMNGQAVPVVTEL